MDSWHENSKKASDISSELRDSELAKLGKFQLIKLIREKDRIIKDMKATIAFMQVKFDRELKEQELMDSLSGKTQQDTYDITWKGVRKVIHILRKHGKAMQTQEIKDKIATLEPERVRAWGAKMSAVEKYVHKAVRSKSVVKISIPGQGYFYSLPEWLDDNRLIGNFWDTKNPR